MAKKQKGKKHTIASPVIESSHKRSFSNVLKIQALLIFAFAFLLYANTIGHKYAVDDTIVITKNTLTTQGFAGIPEIMTTDAFYGFFGEGYKLVEGGRYRPLSIVTFAIEHEFFGGNPHISHFINVVLYGLLGVIIFQVLLMFFRIDHLERFVLTIPFIATLLYVAHPIHTEVVANIKGRDEIMGMLGAMLTLFFSLLYVKKENILFVLLAIISYILALLSKENAITFLAIVPLTLYFFTKADWKKYLITGVPLLLIAVVYVYVRGQITDVGIGKASSEILNNPFVNATLGERLATVSFTFWEYIRLLIVPHPLTHDYYFNQVPVIGWDSPKAILPLILTLAIIGYAIKGIFTKNPIAYGIWFYYITLSIVSNIIFTVGIAMNERFIFISSLGFCLILAILLVKIVNYFTNRSWDSSRLLNPKPAAIVLAIILAGYSVKTFSRNLDWKNDFTLFTADAENSPNSAKIRNALGGELVTQADKVKDPQTRLAYLEKAERVLEEALEIYPGYLNAWLLLGNAKYKLNDSLEEAKYYYQKTLQLKPSYFEGNFNLGCVLLEKGEEEESIPYFKRSIKVKPQKHEPYYNLAEAYFKLSMPDSAIEYYNKMLALRPDMAVGYYKIGLCYGKMKNELDKAIPYLKKATELDPDNMVYLEDLGVAYGFKQDYQNAIKVLEKAIQINPQHAKAYFNLGITYRQIGDETKAQQYFQKAKELDPTMQM